MSFRLGIAAAVMATVAAGAVHAAQYSATSAVGNGSNHSLWIEGGIGGGIGSDFDFIPPGTFTIDGAGVGTLTGDAYSQDVATAGFAVDFTYGAFPVGFNGPPVFKSENGSAPGADIQYTYVTGGTLTGLGDLVGLILGITAKPEFGPEAVQIGSSPDGVTVGPNNKNSNFGMAHWFMVSSITDGCQTTFCDANRANISDLRGRQGDINVDLEAVPLPAGGLLLISGLAVVAGLRRRNGKPA